MSTIARNSYFNRAHLAITGGSAGLLIVGCAVCLLLASTAQAQNANMGAKYVELDQQVTRVTTQFLDAYAITRRSQTGNLETTLYAETGTALADLIVSVDNQMMEVSGLGDAKSTRSFELGIGQPNSDWANAQLYSLWKDVKNLEVAGKVGDLILQEPSWAWRGDFLRLEGKGIDTSIGEKVHGERLNERIVGVTTRFGDIEAVSIRERVSEKSGAGAVSSLESPAFSTWLTDQRTGQPLGRAIWYENAKTFTWHLPGLSSGLVDEQVMEQSFLFQPNQAWSNIQVFGLWQMHLALAVRNADPYAKDTPGCTGLHWLDGTIFRPCCDQHDLCYERHGCTAGSWWVFGASWSCIRCNLTVVFCFATLGGGGGGGGLGGGGLDPFNQDSGDCGTVGTVCPAWCSGSQCLAR